VIARSVFVTSIRQDCRSMDHHWLIRPLRYFRFLRDDGRILLIQDWISRSSQSSASAKPLLCLPFTSFNRAGSGLRYSAL
jgi:hypothetical protein